MTIRLRQLAAVVLIGSAALPALAAGGGGEPSLFAKDPFSYIWNLLMFLVLLTVLWLFVWPKILDGLRAREAKLRHDLETAENSAREAEQALAQRKAELAEAQKEAQAVIEQSKKDAEQVAARVKADAESEITRMKQRAEADIASAKELAVAEVYDRIADLSTQIAGRILSREINPQDQQQLISESLSELSNVSRN